MLLILPILLPMLRLRLNGHGGRVVAQGASVERLLPRHGDRPHGTAGGLLDDGAVVPLLLLVLLLLVLLHPPRTQRVVPEPLLPDGFPRIHREVVRLELGGEGFLLFLPVPEGAAASRRRRRRQLGIRRQLGRILQGRQRRRRGCRRLWLPQKWGRQLPLLLGKVLPDLPRRRRRLLFLPQCGRHLVGADVEAGGQLLQVPDDEGRVF